MKKFKKVFAVILSLAMVLGMSMTSFADETAVTKDGGKVKVSNLSKETTVVNVYQIATLDTANSKWTIPSWVPPTYVEKDSDNNIIGIRTLTEEEWVKLKNAAVSNAAELKELDGYTDDEDNNIHGYVTETGSWESSEKLPIGLYLVTASGTTTSYKMMAGLNYSYPAQGGLIQAHDANITAKPESYKLTKTFSDESSSKFINRGDILNYTIKGYVPVFDNDNNKSYWISDTPTGLTIKNVTVDGLTVETDYKIYKGTVENNVFTKNGAELVVGENGAIEVSEGDTIAVEFTDAYLDKTAGGTLVKVNVAAQATGDPFGANFQGYTNTTNSNHASEPDTPPTATTGSLTINKTDTDDVPLNGAQFQITRTVGDTTSEALYFVQVGDVANNTVTYKLASEGEKDATQTVGSDQASTIRLTGLGNGTYNITETKAPEGYSTNPNIVSKTINGEDESAINVSADVKDDRLSSLPSTGGIGTTIFTIGGCAIMIIAAALFFASRRRAAK